MGCPLKSFAVANALLVPPWVLLFVYWLGNVPRVVPFLRGFSVDCNMEITGPCVVPPLFSSTWSKLAFNAALIVFWVVPHSVLARRPVKLALLPKVGNWYRSLYVMHTLVMLYGQLFLWQPVFTDQPPIWDLAGTWWSVPFYLVTLAGFGISKWMGDTIDITKHLGLYMAWDCENIGKRMGHPGSDLTPDSKADIPNQETAGLVTPFTDRGPFAFVRHPGVMCQMMYLYITPTMTWNRLVYAIPLHLYCEIGCFLFEEKDMEYEFGDVWREYQKRVDGRWPFLGKLYAARQTLSEVEKLPLKAVS